MNKVTVDELRFKALSFWEKAIESAKLIDQTSNSLVADALWKMAVHHSESARINAKAAEALMRVIRREA